MRILFLGDVVGKAGRLAVKQFLPKLKELMNAAYNNREDIEMLVEEMVPTYHPDNGGRKDDTYKKLYKEAVGTH